MRPIDRQWAEVERALVALAQATGAWSDARVQRSINVAVRRKNKERVDFLLRRFEHALAVDNSNFHPFLPDPEPAHLGGEGVRLGSLASQSPVWLGQRDILLNVFISGPPRQGKSVLVTQLVTQLLEARIPVHIFDTQGEYADVLEPRFPSLECVDLRDCRVNPFTGPKDMSPKDWVLGPMCDYLREALWWRDRTIELFRSICLDLLPETLTPPTFAAAFDKVPNYKKNTAEAGSLQRFTTMIRSLDTFQCQKGESIETLARKSRIYDLWNVSKDVRQFFVSHMMTLHKASRRYRRDRDLEIVFVFDELSQFITKESIAAKADLGESFFLELLRTGRKMGVGCVLADQTYSLIHQVVRTNCQTKIAFETNDGPSRQAIARDYSLNTEQREFLGQLSFEQEQRRALAQIPTYPRPILVRVENFEKPPPLSPRDVKKRRQRVLEQMEWEPLPEPPPKTGNESDAGILPDKMLRILKTIVFDYFATQQEHARKMEIAESTFSKYAKRLKEAGLLREESIHKGRRGGKVKILLPTQQGYEYLDEAQISYKPMPGNGSATHRYWQHRILEKVKQKGDVGGIEFSLNNKRVDVGVVDLHTRTAYEVVIEGSLQKELSNLRKDLAEGWDHVVFCVQNGNVQRTLAALIRGEPGDADHRAEVRLLRDFL